MSVGNFWSFWSLRSFLLNMFYVILSVVNPCKNLIKFTYNYHIEKSSRYFFKPTGQQKLSFFLNINRKTNFSSMKLPTFPIRKSTCTSSPPSRRTTWSWSATVSPTCSSRTFSRIAVFTRNIVLILISKISF